MSVSTNMEMRVRGRPPSDAPAKALARLLKVKPRGRRKELLAVGAHVATAGSLRAARGLLERFEPSHTAGGFVLFGLAMTPDAVVLPALGASRPQWR